MTWLEALVRITGLAGPSITAVLNVAATDPNTADAAATLRAKLEESLTPDGLADVALALPGEVLNIFKLKLEPADHPGDHI